jgi:MFS transporter, DHA2 family, multidrug resistance protein
MLTHRDRHRVRERLVTELQRRCLTAGLMIATAIQVADALIANVALPQLERELGGGIELGTWIITSYLCATAVMAPLTGWLRRRYGAARLFPVTVGMFIASSLLCALAPSAGWMIVFRIVQGAGAGLISPLAQAILLDIHPAERHGRVMALWGAALMVGPILGPLLGGIITDLASWRGVFAINLPLGLLVIMLMRGFVDREDVATGERIDAFSVVLLAIGIGALELTLERSIGRSWLESPELVSEATVTILALALLCIRSGRSGFSVFRLDLFKDVNFAGAAFYNFMTSGLVFVAVVFLPALAQGPLSYSATLAGFTIVPRAIVMTLAMLVVGRLIGRVRYPLLLGTGWVLMALGLGILARLEPAEALIWMLVGSTVQAVGGGFLFTPHSTLAFVTLDPAQRTDAAGVYSLIRQLGFASGVALMSAVLRTRISANLAAVGNSAGMVGSAQQQADAATLAAYSDCFGIMALAAIAVIPGVLVFRVATPADVPATSARVDS